ncbi:hypothetical protein GYMLUDRAFT_401033 [Collybiopsis luxurians FD-317 M1]|nr:hypothetical protein GYMLUDRAFT_401033 [Collybiopsis luxurians FD-317 M1]
MMSKHRSPLRLWLVPVLPSKSEKQNAWLKPSKQRSARSDVLLLNFLSLLLSHILPLLFTYYGLSQLASLRFGSLYICISHSFASLCVPYTLLFLLLIYLRNSS